ncbi:12060_t:CDS:1, partial [Ambispora gerdemannii]
SPYEFKLLYRGSRDGFAASKFHELCGSQSQTVVVVKINQTERIIGGYNPSIWSGNIYERLIGNIRESLIGNNSGICYGKDAPDAFIFSISGGNVKFSRSVSGNQIAYDPCQNTGPYFFNDLFISDKCNQNASSWYDPNYFRTPNISIWDKNTDKDSKYFKVDELEVFQIILI